ncbi:MAG: archaellin/type IV pilin N-terminal domain-containing protein, partial [Candidatus Nezhaarchaeales archaeon]
MSKRGLTGIETAIILIAFVISASVFAFAVLNMGMVTT